MKKLLLSITLLLLPISFANEKIPITITKIIDGDTVKVKVGFRYFPAKQEILFSIK